jgi:hypothetical protein
MIRNPRKTITKRYWGTDISALEAKPAHIRWVVAISFMATLASTIPTPRAGSLGQRTPVANEAADRRTGPATADLSGTFAAARQHASPGKGANCGGLVVNRL